MHPDMAVRTDRRVSTQKFREYCKQCASIFIQWWEASEMNRFVGKPRIGAIGVGWIGYRHAKYCGSHAN